MRISLIYTEVDPWALGMRSVAAVLRETGYEPRLFFLGTSEESYSSSTLKLIERGVNGSDVIGVSCMASGSEKARQVLERLRPSGAFTVWGGIHATIYPEDCVSSVDVVCRGEGEGLMIELIERLDAGLEWKDLLNAAYLEDGQMVINNLRPLIQDLDALPVQYHSEDHERHLKNGRLVPPSEIFDVREPIMFNGSRGCIYRCTYCVNATLKRILKGTGRYYRKLSIQRYIDCIGELKQHFPLAKYLYLIDEDFFLRTQEEVKYFADELPRRIGLPYECMGSPVQCSIEKMSLLVKAGLWRIRIGLESGSERTKKEIYDRHMPNEEVLRSAHIIKSFPRVVLAYFYIIANPYEETADLLQTIGLFTRLPYPFYSQVYSLVFFPGTVLFDNACKDRLIEGKRDSGYELDYKAGLRYSKHRWKRKNLYLNTLLFLMEGKTGWFRIGLLPRFLVPLYIHPQTIRVMNSLPFLTKGALHLKVLLLQVRKQVAYSLQRVMKNPQAVYDLKRFLTGRLER